MMPIETLTNQLEKYRLVFPRVGGNYSISLYFGHSSFQRMLQIELIGIAALIRIPVAFSNSLHLYGKLVKIIGSKVRAVKSVFNSDLHALPKAAVISFNELIPNIEIESIKTVRKPDEN